MYGFTCKKDSTYVNQELRHIKIVKKRIVIKRFLSGRKLLQTIVRIIIQHVDSSTFFREYSLSIIT